MDRERFVVVARRRLSLPTYGPVGWRCPGGGNVDDPPGRRPDVHADHLDSADDVVTAATSGHCASGHGQHGLATRSRAPHARHACAVQAAATSNEPLTQHTVHNLKVSS